MKDIFTVIVYGSYLAEANPLIRGCLTRKFLTVKSKVLGIQAKKIVVVIPDVTALSALVTLTAKSLRMETVQRPLSTEEVAEIDLAIKIVLNPSKTVPDGIKNQVQQVLDQQNELYSNNPRTYTMKIPFSANLLAEKRVQEVPTEVKRPDQRTSAGNYSNFDKVKDFVEQNVKELPPKDFRNNIPDHGPEVYPDTNMAGGLQQS